MAVAVSVTRRFKLGGGGQGREAPVWNEKVICRGCKEGDLEKGQKDSLEKEMATHSSILAWRTP